MKKAIISVVIIIILIGVSQWAFTKWFAANDTNTDINPIGHRGDVTRALENTIPAMREAKKAGANTMELDIMMTKDHRFVVIHDHNLTRLAGVDKEVSELSYDEIKKLTIQDDIFRGHIALLSDFIDEAKRLDMKLIIELKPQGTEPKSYMKQLAHLLHEKNVDHMYQVMSINYSAIKAFKQQAPHIETGLIVLSNYQTYDLSKLDFLVFHHFSYDKLSVNEAIAQGKDVYLWTMRGVIDVQAYRNAPIKGMITDHIDAVIQEKAH